MYSIKGAGDCSCIRKQRFPLTKLLLKGVHIFASRPVFVSLVMETSFSTTKAGDQSTSEARQSSVGSQPSCNTSKCWRYTDVVHSDSVCNQLCMHILCFFLQVATMSFLVLLNFALVHSMAT